MKRFHTMTSTGDYYSDFTILDDLEDGTDHVVGIWVQKYGENNYRVTVTVHRPDICKVEVTYVDQEVRV